MDPVCQACGFQGESINHIIFCCSIARQVWVLTDVPYPESGFVKCLIFSNFHSLLLLIKNSSVPEGVRNSIPWIMWYFWKYRNGIIFEGKQAKAIDLVAKIREEAEFWLMAQKNEEQRVKEEQEAVMVVKKSWSAPPNGWLKFNLGVYRNKEHNICGVAWVLRDDTG